MQLLDYINSHEYWEEELLLAPYNFNITYDGNYIMVNYDKKVGNYDLNIVKEANCCIVRYDDVVKKYICVNWPGKKIIEYSKENVLAIDWENVKVWQKIDGISFYAWSDFGVWHFCTQNFINIPESDVVMRTLHGDKFAGLTHLLSPAYCYNFILDTTTNKLWYIAKHSLLNLKGDSDRLEENELVSYPKYFPHIKSLNMLENLQKITEEHECGFIVVDKNDNYFSFSGDAYSRIKLQQEYSLHELVEIWKKEGLGNYKRLFPNNTLITLVDDVFSNLINNLEERYRLFNMKNRGNAEKNLPRHLPCTAKYFYYRLQNETIDDIEYFLKTRCTIDELQQEVRSEMIYYTMQKVRVR